MAATSCALLVLIISAVGLAQRGSYSGRRPVGYPIITTSSTAAPNTTPLVDKFGEGEVSTTTIRLPAEALGDRELFDRLSKLPADQQPFWLLNWQALEANRNNPQTYQPNSNSFIGLGIRDPQTNSQFNSQFNSQPNSQSSAQAFSQNAQPNFQSIDPTFFQNSRNQVNVRPFINPQSNSLIARPESNQFRMGSAQLTNGRFPVQDNVVTNFEGDRQFNSGRNFQQNPVNRRQSALFFDY